MATAEQVKSLIRSHSNEDKEHFYAIALQVAAHEARQGHSTLAHEIRELIDKDRKQTKSRSFKVIQFPKELSGLVETSQANSNLGSLVLDRQILDRINRIIQEYYQRSKLKPHGLTNRRKLLLAGPPGTGKTLTAAVLANELKLPLNIVQVDRLVTKFMGETSAKLRLIFDLIQKEPAVYLFDEFDAIGADRSMENDVGEIRRVLNSFLQFIENDSSESIIIAATNNSKILDQALFRRFDDVLHYNQPSELERKKLFQNILVGFIPARMPWLKILKASDGLSHAEITNACKDSIKVAILDDKTKISSAELHSAISHRHDAYLGR